MTTLQVHLPVLQETQECGLCLETSPRQLPCSHRFCLACLRQIIQSLPESGTFPCPTCRSPTDVLAGGVKNLQGGFNWNIHDQRLLKINQEMYSCCRGQERRRCDKECCETVAKKCSSGDKMQRDRDCVIHPGEKLRFYCNKCSTPICRDCKMTTHEGHSASALGQKSNHAKDLIALISKMSSANLEPKLRQLILDAENHQKSVQKNRETIKAVLEQRAEDMKAIINQAMLNAKEELDEETENVDEIVTSSINNMMQSLASLVSLTQYAQSTAERQCDADVVDVLSALKRFFAEANITGTDDFELLDPHLRLESSSSDSWLSVFLAKDWRRTVELDESTMTTECPFCSFKYFYKARNCPVCSPNTKPQPSKTFLGLKKKSGSASTPQLRCNNCCNTYDIAYHFCPTCGTPASQDLLATIQAAIPRYIGHVSQRHQSESEDVGSHRQRRKTADVKTAEKKGSVQRSVSQPVSGARAQGQSMEILNTTRTLHFLLQDWE